GRDAGRGGGSDRGLGRGGEGRWEEGKGASLTVGVVGAGAPGRCRAGGRCSQRPAPGRGKEAWGREGGNWPRRGAAGGSVGRSPGDTAGRGAAPSPARCSGGGGSGGRGGPAA